MSIRALKKEIHTILLQSDKKIFYNKIHKIDPIKGINALFSFFCHKEILLKWHAVTAMGELVYLLSQDSLDDAKNILRRLMWSLNDESGQVGWGAPEAMGEILLKVEPLANEFSKILVSYVSPKGNYLDNLSLQQGVLWAIGRLATRRWELINNAEDILISNIFSKDRVHKGLSMWALRKTNNKKTIDLLKKASEDNFEISLYIDFKINKYYLNELLSLG